MQTKTPKTQPGLPSARAGLRPARAEGKPGWVFGVFFAFFWVTVQGTYEGPLKAFKEPS